jgi:bacillithiol biosynthesis cysteine-adding enzyme BshC
MRIEARSPTGPPLATSWLNDEPAARGLLSRDPRSSASYLAKAKEIDTRVGQEERRIAASCLVGGGENAAKRIRSFLDNRGFVVTTGQQPGLLGGPLYGLYKGLTAASLARRMETLLERPVLPVFWIASEDHDWDEARSTHVIDIGNDLQDISLSAGEPGLDRPLYQIPAGPEVLEVLKRFQALMPDTEFLPHWKELLDRAYQPDVSLAHSYQEVMEALLGPSGVFMVQSHHPELKARALPILLQELRESKAREAAQLVNAASIEAAGFALQVPLIPQATNVFAQGGTRRERIFRDGDGFRLRGSERKISYGELEALGAEAPWRLSPNVLLRPVVENILFPTLSYVAGPGETSYLPQTAPVFAGLGIEMPVIHPRVSLTVIETKIDKVLMKFCLSPDDLDVPPQELAGKLARESIPEDIQAALATLRQSLGGDAQALADSVSPLDPTLSGSVQAFRKRSFRLLADVERKVVQSLKRENETTLSQVGKAQAHLFPTGQPQERVLNPFYYLIRYDQGFLAALQRHAEEAVLP